MSVPYDQQMHAPDLANSLVGVSTRLCQNSVAIMADMEDSAL